MDHRKAVEAVLTPDFRGLGWRKRRLTWHQARPETFLVFHVEKNRWGADAYSFHCGIEFASSVRHVPPYYRCSITTTLEDLASDQLDTKIIGDFENQNLTPDGRLAKIRELVFDVAVPWLESYSTIAALRELASVEYSELLPRVHIWRSVYDWLRDSSLNVPPPARVVDTRL